MSALATEEGATLGSVPPAPRWRGSAFGLDLSSDVPLVGLGSSPGTSTRPVALRLCEPSSLRAAWPRRGAGRMREVRRPNGDVAMAVDRHPEGGYRIAARGFGRFIVPPAADEVLCAPPRTPPWSWQRLLVGQVLPLTAALRGLEVLHAAAVVSGGRGIALAGDSGAGKTSLVLQLVLRGAKLLSDDVLALEARGADVLGHPGGAILSVRQDEIDRVRAAGHAPPGVLVARGVKTYLEQERAGHAVPVAAVYLLERTEVRSRSSPVEELSEPDPRRLLGATFSTMVREPSRLLAQLDVHARLARSARVFRLTIGPSTGAAALAQILDEHVATLPEPA